MEAVLDNLGLVGLFFISFLSSTLYPLGSEVFVVLALKLDYEALQVWIVATLGNTLGSLSTYLLGFLGKEYLINKYYSKAYAKLHKLENFIKKYGFLCAFLTFLPLIGDVFALGLGVFKYSWKKCVFFIAFGKGARYLALIALF